MKTCLYCGGELTGKRKLTEVMEEWEGVELIQSSIGWDWRIVKKLFPRKGKKFIEKVLLQLWNTKEFDFAPHRLGEKYNYDLQIPGGEKLSVGFIRKKQ